MTHRPNKLATGVVIGILLLLPACRTAPAGIVSTAVYGIATQPVRLNPLTQPDIVSRWAIELVFDGLLDVDDHLNLVPALATAWETSPDGLTLTFHLRRGIRWHDGQPFTSRDVKFTYDTIRNPSVTPTLPKGDYASIRDIEAPNEYTVAFHLSHPDASLPSKLVTGIAPRHLLAGQDLETTDFNRQPVGTGPFRLSSWQSDQRLTFIANPDYFGGKPGLDQIVWKVVPDTTALTLQLCNGEVDGAAVSTTRDLDRILRAPNLVHYPVLGGVFQISLQLENPLFQQPEVRQAMAYAIDKQAMVDKLMSGAATIATSDILPSSWAYDPKANPYRYDPDRAAALLEAAGWQSGTDGVRVRNGQPMHFELATDAGDRLREDLVLLVQQQWRAVGIQADITLIERNAFIFDHLLKGQFDAALLQSSVRTDPDLSRRFHSRSIFAGQNFCYYADPEVDALLDQGLAISDQARRKDVYWKVQELMAEDLPQIPLFYPTTGFAFHASLSGIRPSSMSPFWNVEAWSR